MSDPWAIAAVTETLVQQLGRIAAEDTTLGPLKVTALPLDRARLGTNKDARQLNLFLYQVTPNQGWANHELPVRASDGALRRQPTLALDLHYLLTAFGDKDDERDAQHALGHAMAYLHDQAVLSRDAVRGALDAAGGPIRAADLDKQVELVRLSLQRLSDEDVFRMWTVFSTPYRVSVGYQASLVLLERRQTFRAAPPVRASQVVALPFEPPVIESVEPSPAHAGDTLVLHGRALASGTVTVRFGDVDVAVPAAAATSTRVSVALPGALRAGPNTVQVLTAAPLPDGSGSRPFLASEVGVFLLAPTITTAIPAAGIAVARGADLVLALAPAVGRDQRVSVVVGDQAIARTVAATDPASATNVTFRIPPAPFPAGTFLLRVMVDGAPTGLIVDSTPGSPTEGQYVGPRVKVT